MLSSKRHPLSTITNNLTFCNDEGINVKNTCAKVGKRNENILRSTLIPPPPFTRHSGLIKKTNDFNPKSKCTNIIWKKQELFIIHHVIFLHCAPRVPIIKSNNKRFYCEAATSKAKVINKEIYSLLFSILIFLYHQ